MTRAELVEGIARAVATMEGFYTHGSVAARNNNPGNLRRWGSVRVEDGYACFPSVVAGWEALRSQVARNVRRGLTLRTFFAGQRDAAGEVVKGGYPGYAPSADGNHPKNYAEYVAARVGISPDAVLLDVARVESQAQSEEKS